MHYVDGCENDTVQVSCTALSLARTSVLQGGVLLSRENVEKCIKNSEYFDLVSESDKSQKCCKCIGDMVIVEHYLRGFFSCAFMGRCEMA